jgi:predicted MarR family transcription regulator
MDRTRKNLRDIVLIVQLKNIHAILRYHCKVNILVELILATMREKEVITLIVPY